MPSQNDSSIVVLENYDPTLRGVRCATEEGTVREPQLLNLSLLKMNTRVSYAFSDRLLEYLLGNVIYDRETYFNNIAMVQTALSKKFPEYRKSLINGQHKKGIWDRDISRLVYQLVEDAAKSNILYDQDGNINRDTELLLYSHGGTM